MALRDIDVLGAAVQEGRAQAQVPHLHISFTPQQQQAAEEYEDKIKDLIDRGMLGWVLFNPKPGLKHVYTHEPRNPNTKRLVSAYLSMTQLAVLTYGKELFDLYDNSSDKRQYPAGPGNSQLKFLNFGEFQSKLLKEAIEAPVSFHNEVNRLSANLVLNNSNAKQKVDYKQLDATGHVVMISQRKLDMFVEVARTTPGNLRQWAEKNKIGPNTLVKDNAGGQHYIQFTAIRMAGKHGIDWLVDKGFTPTIEWYLHATFSRGANVLDLWEHLEQSGVSPKLTSDSGTLWHVYSEAHFDDNRAAADWIKARGVDWSVKNANGKLPIERMLFNVLNDCGNNDFITGPVGRSIVNIIAAGNPRLAQSLQQPDSRPQVHRTIVIEMINSGVSLEEMDNQGFAVKNVIHPDQLTAERYLEKIGGNLFTADHNELARVPEAYGSKQVAFIREIEQASGIKLLRDPGTTPPLLVRGMGKKP